jgi:hypothetical protein
MDNDKKEWIRKKYNISFCETAGKTQIFCRECGQEILAIGNGQDQYVVYDLLLDSDGEIQFDNVGDNECTGDNDLISRSCGHTLGPWDEDVAKELLKLLEGE